MAPGFQADAGLWPHAKQLNEISDALRAAARSARLAGLPAEACGRFCARFPMLLNKVEQAGAAALDRTAVAMESAATGVRATADEYDRVDRGFAGRVASNDKPDG